MSEIIGIEELPEGTFPINLKLIQKYQRTEPSIKAKYKDDTYHKGYFWGGSYIDIKIITCKDNIFILSKLQSYLLYWYHTYLRHPGMVITEAMISQNLYWPDAIDDVHKKVTNCDNCQSTKRLKTKWPP